jgi:uncharacterized metal-binding protein YceD (DUF177 family)
MDIYRIDLKKLAQASSNHFDYVLGNEFFEGIDGQEVRQGKVNVSLSVVRASSAFEMNFYIQGSIVGTCDRCLEDMEIPIETRNRLIVTFGEAFSEISDQHIVISEEDGFINVAWYMYEFIALAIPIQHIHEFGECNELMASKLRELSVEEVGEGEIEAENRPSDPRWDALRPLIGDN